MTVHASVPNTMFYVFIIPLIAPSNGRLDVIELSLIPPTTEQSLNSRYQVVLNIQDDDIALQDPESVNLQLGISPQSSCSKVNFSPLNTTTIFVHDDDGKYSTIQQDP